MIVVELTTDWPEAPYRERDEREVRRFALVANLHDRNVHAYRSREKRRTLLHQARMQRILGRP